MKNCLEGEQDHEAHREAEETHGFRQGESQNGVGEQLTLERGVTGVADDQGAEHVSDTSSRSSDTDCGGSGTDVLGGRVNVLSDCSGAQATHSHRRLGTQYGGHALGDDGAGERDGETLAVHDDCGCGLSLKR